MENVCYIQVWTGRCIWSVLFLSYSKELLTGNFWPLNMSELSNSSDCTKPLMCARFWPTDSSQQSKIAFWGLWASLSPAECCLTGIPLFSEPGLQFWFYESQNYKLTSIKWNFKEAIFTSAGPGWGLARAELTRRAPEGASQEFWCWDTGNSFWGERFECQKAETEARLSHQCQVGCAGLCSGSGSELGSTHSSELWNSDFCPGAPGQVFWRT